MGYWVGDSLGGHRRAVWKEKEEILECLPYMGIIENETGGLVYLSPNLLTY